MIISLLQLFVNLIFILHIRSEIGPKFTCVYVCVFLTDMPTPFIDFV